MSASPLTGAQLNGGGERPHTSRRVQNQAFSVEPRGKESLRKCEQGPETLLRKGVNECFQNKKGWEENSERGWHWRSTGTFKCFIVAIKKMLGKEKEEGKMLLSFKFLFSFLKKRHVSDGAEAYFRLFWEMMLVSLDSNQPGRGDVSNRVQAWISEAESDSDLCPEARHDGSQDVCKGELVALGLCRDTTKTQGELPFLWLCPLGLSNLQGKKKKILGGKKKQNNSS